MTKKTCERLIRQVLGEQASEIVIKRIIEQAAGNALYLEELIRAVAEGRGESLQPTVLAMLQARLSRLLPDARRVLRAASVYGQVFWRGGLFEPNVEEWLQILIEAEFIEKHRDSRFPEEVEYGFRHALMREAAYGMLSDAERKALHLQAAQYLSQAGERDPIILAEHFQRAGQAASALPYYVRAAEQALESYDLASARTRAECGIACNAQGCTLGALHCILCLTAYWQDAWAQAYQPGSEALHLLKPGSIKWCKAIGIMCLVTSTGPLEWQTKFGELVGAIGQVEPFRLVVSEAYLADGQIQNARNELRQAMQQLEIRAAKIPDFESHARYLNKVADNARLQELAQRWLGDTYKEPFSAPATPAKS